jgi:hypothetical protein
MKEHQHADKKEPQTKPAHDEVAKRAYSISKQVECPCKLSKIAQQL